MFKALDWQIEQYLRTVKLLYRWLGPPLVQEQP